MDDEGTVGPVDKLDLIYISINYYYLSVILHAAVVICFRSLWKLSLREWWDMHSRTS